jgi:ABC-type multidrug transport system ATPase subunit
VGGRDAAVTAPGSGPPALEARGLSRTFGRIVAVQDVDLSVRRGSVFGLLGPNGSGKSTMIRMFCGLLRPTAGAIRVLGHDPLDRAHDVRRVIGYMSQRFSLYDELTGHENLTFFARAHGFRGGALAKRRREVADLVGLGEYEERRAGTLSGGWKQRLALACALLHDPQVLFLDEPTAGIDPVARRSLWSLLFDLAAGGKTLFVSTHYMDEAERCDHLGYIFLGRLLVYGTPRELKALGDATPPGFHRFEVVSDDVTDAFRALHDRAGVHDATVFGDAVHLLAQEPLGAEALRAMLPPPLAASSRIREAQPSLEDVFVEMTRKATKAG